MAYIIELFLLTLHSNIFRHECIGELLPVRNALNSEVGIVKASASINYRDFKSAK